MDYPTNDLKLAMELAESSNNCREKGFALAVPFYTHIDGEFDNYLGVKVWEHLPQDDFNFVPIWLKVHGDSSNVPRLMRSVRGKTVYVIHPIYLDADGHSKNGGKLISATKMSRGTPLLFEPYNRDWRQDTRYGREPITARLTADSYSHAGLEVYLGMDFHFKQLPGFFECPAEGFDLNKQFAQFIRDRRELGNLAVCSPDEGAVKRSIGLSEHLGGLPMIYIYQARDPEKPDNKKVLKIVGDVEDLDVIIRDDVTGTAGTVVNARTALLDRGARSVSAAISHLDLSEGAAQRLCDSGIHVYGTDGVPLRGKIPPDCMGNFDIMPLGPMIADIIARDSKGASLSSLYELH